MYNLDMQAREALHKINALPPDAQAIVFDLLETLEKRFVKKTKPTLGSQMQGLRSDPFIGMWHDREEMRDSADYIHKLRRDEWERTNNP
ncbi:MAG: hypothetical protein KIH69_007200 [Anaerolineae bacterium]|nr:hypothetical protein [Anaerolineae bacterium]